MSFKLYLKQKKRTLYIVTAFIGKKGYKNEASQLINAKSPDVTAETGSVVTSNDSISHSTENVKQKQLEIIEKVNPAPNSYNTWIISPENVGKAVLIYYVPIKNGTKIEYKNEDLSQVNPQLYEWLAIINDKSSDNNISQKDTVVNNQYMHESKTNPSKYSISGANAKDGRIILYATNGKIKKAGNVHVNSLKIRGSGLNSNFFNSISDNDKNVKQKQLEIIEKVNPAPNSYNT